MLFYSFFKSLVGQKVTVELKNDLAVEGTLHSVDQFLNLKLSDVRVPKTDQSKKHPQATYLKNSLIRGSVVRYVFLSPDQVDTSALQDATRKEGNR